MTIKTSTGQLIQDPTQNKIQPPPSVPQLAQQANSGTPTTPVGAKSVGANPIQAGMQGTPQQRQNAIKQATPVQPTLEQAERTETAAGATNSQQAAKDKMQTIEQLGAVKGRIESLIQKTLTPPATSTPFNPAVASQALAGIADPQKQADAKVALANYSAAPTPENLQKVYDIVGRGGIDTGISQLFQSQADTIGSQFAGQDVTLGTLDLSQAGTDVNQLSAALNLTPEQLQGMTLTQLQGAIDAVQAQEFTSFSQLQAKLADPTISPQERQAIQEQMRQLGAAGISGIEGEVDSLQADIDTARMVNIQGQDYTVEELLGDDGISELVKQAVNDPKKLNDMLKDQRLAALGQFINQHKTALTALSRQMDAQGADFLKNQDTYAALKSSLGEGTDSVLKAILGSDFKNSVLSGDLADLQSKLAASGLYQALKADPKLTAEVQGDPQLLSKLVASGFTAQQVKDAVNLRNDIEADPMISKLLGVDGSIPTDAASLAKAQQAVARYKAIDPRIVSQAAAYVDSGDMDINDLELLAKAKDPAGVLQDLQEWKQAQTAFKDATSGVAPAQQAMKTLFGGTDFNARDLEFSLRSASPEAKQQALALFDLDKDGQISDDELHSSEVLDKVKGLMGIGANASKIIGQDGAYAPGELVKLLQGVGVDKNSYEKGMSTAISKNALDNSRALGKVQETQTAALQKAQSDYKLKEQEMLSSPKIQRSIDAINAISINAQDGVSYFVDGVPYSADGKPFDPNRKLGALEIVAGDMGKDPNALTADKTAIKSMMSKGIDKLSTAELSKLQRLVNRYTPAAGAWFKDTMNSQINSLIDQKSSYENELVGLRMKTAAAQSDYDKTKKQLDYFSDVAYNASSLNEQELYELSKKLGVL